MIQSFTAFKLECIVCNKEFGVLGFSSTSEDDDDKRRSKLADIARTLEHFEMKPMCENCNKEYRESTGVDTREGNLREEGYK